MTEEFNLGEKIEYIDENGENDELARSDVLRKKYVKEFIRLCEDNSEEINGASYIKVSKMQKFAGDKLK